MITCTTVEFGICRVDQQNKNKQINLELVKRIGSNDFKESWVIFLFLCLFLDWLTCTVAVQVLVTLERVICSNIKLLVYLEEEFTVTPSRLLWLSKELHTSNNLLYMLTTFLLYNAQYRRSGNFRVIKFSCFKFLCKNFFVVQDTHENFLTVLRSQVQ